MTKITAKDMVAKNQIGKPIIKEQTPETPKHKVMTPTQPKENPQRYTEQEELEFTKNFEEAEQVLAQKGEVKYQLMNHETVYRTSRLAQLKKDARGYRIRAVIRGE
jgi:hypothetical protein